jgi:protoporphyrinogen oxidase
MKTIILGAGITGLSMARLLQNAHQEVIILEKEATIGGIAKTKQIGGTTYHPVGGHCFNSKHPDVMAFIFKILPPDQWHKITRCSKIDLNSYEVDYPILYPTDLPSRQRISLQYCRRLFIHEQ